MSKKLVLAGVGSVLLLAGGAYTAAYFVAGNQVPADAQAAGVAIGGISPAEAEEKLRAELAPRTTQPITFSTPVGGTGTIVPADAGMDIDYAQTVQSAGGGFSWNPVHIFHSLTGGEAVDLLYAIDQETLTAAVEEQAAKLKVEPEDATIALEDGEIKVTESVTGYELDVEATAANVEEGFKAGATTAEAAGAEKSPAVTDEQVKQFQDGPLKKAVGTPISLTSPSGNIELTEDELKELVTIEGTAPEWKVGYDKEKLAEVTKADVKELAKDGPKNASYKFEGGKPVVVPGESGLTINADSVAKAFDAAFNGEKRTVALEATQTEPEFTTEQATKLLPTKVVGQFSTQYPHAAYRNTNIGRAAEKVNGTVLLPGETFSMNGTVGERTAANGFADGYVIQGGNLVKESGGGVSQAATTLFNAAFFAGFDIVEHKPHSLYFPRYPAGREATLYYGAVDLRFKNDTEYPAIIQSYTDPSASGKKGTVTFKVWAIPTWDKVESTELKKSNFYRGRDRVSTAHNCEPQSPIEGFTVNYERLFYKDGEVVKREPFKWTYNAGDRITCE